MTILLAFAALRSLGLIMDDTHPEEATNPSSDQKIPHFSRAERSMFHFRKILIRATEDQSARHPCEEDLEGMHALSMDAVHLQKPGGDAHHHPKQLGQHDQR